MKIGLVGYSRTGKNTVAQMIDDYLHATGLGKTKQLAFGDELKKRFFQAFPEARHGKKPREAYEKFGELGRGIDEDFWVKPVEQEMKFYSGIYDNFIVTDCRQPNEAKFLKDNDFILIKVWSPEEIRRERSKGDSNWIPVNPSEKKLETIRCNYVVWNLYDLENTKEQVEFIIEKGILKNGNY